VARARFRTEFGAALDAQVRRRRLTQSSVATAAGVSQPYINRLIKGTATASPEWIEIIAETVGADQEERQRLHRAAARDRGYKIGLD
jgi:predicted transcriptional regulator